VDERRVQLNRKVKSTERRCLLRGFADILKELREKAGLSQVSLAERVGISNTYISALESGRKVAPPYAIVTALANSLGVPEHDLWHIAQEERRARMETKLKGSPIALRSAAKDSALGALVRAKAVGVETLARESLDPEGKEVLEALAMLKAAIPDNKKRAEAFEAMQKLLRL
jgi:transcriptional regulator with XRE-family HTH domain